MAIADDIRISQRFDPEGKNGGYLCERSDAAPALEKVVSVLTVRGLPTQCIPHPSDSINIRLAAPCADLPGSVLLRHIDGHTLRHHAHMDTVNFDCVIHEGEPVKVAGISIDGKSIQHRFWRVITRGTA